MRRHIYFLFKLLSALNISLNDTFFSNHDKMTIWHVSDISTWGFLIINFFFRINMSILYHNFQYCQTTKVFNLSVLLKYISMQPTPHKKIHMHNNESKRLKTSCWNLDLSKIQGVRGLMSFYSIIVFGPSQISINCPEKCHSYV